MPDLVSMYGMILDGGTNTRPNGMKRNNMHQRRALRSEVGFLRSQRTNFISGCACGGYDDHKRFHRASSCASPSGSPLRRRLLVSPLPRNDVEE